MVLNRSAMRNCSGWHLLPAPIAQISGTPAALTTQHQLDLGGDRIHRVRHVIENGKVYAVRGFGQVEHLMYRDAAGGIDIRMRARMTSTLGCPRVECRATIDG